MNLPVANVPLGDIFVYSNQFRESITEIWKRMFSNFWYTFSFQSDTRCVLILLLLMFWKNSVKSLKIWWTLIMWKQLVNYINTDYTFSCNTDEFSINEDAYYLLEHATIDKRESKSQKPRKTVHFKMNSLYWKWAKTL